MDEPISVNDEKKCDIPMPSKPKLLTKGSIQVLLMGLGMLSLSIYLLFVGPGRVEFSEEPITFLLFVIIGVIGGFLVWFVPYAYFCDLRDYSEASKDFDGYVKRKEQERAENLRRAEENLRKANEAEKEKKKAEAERLERLPQCPICGKKDCVKRLSTLNRSASIAAFGLASSKIGKQYQCERCKHLW